MTFQPLSRLWIILLIVLASCAACASQDSAAPIDYGTGMALRTIIGPTAELLCVDVATAAFREGDENDIEVTRQVFDTLTFALDDEPVELDYEGLVTGEFPELTFCLEANTVAAGVHRLTAQAVSSAGNEHTDQWVFEVRHGQALIILNNTVSAPIDTTPAS